jgi:hypothetical protein
MIIVPVSKTVKKAQFPWNSAKTPRKASAKAESSAMDLRSRKQAHPHPLTRSRWIRHTTAISLRTSEAFS